MEADAACLREDNGAPMFEDGQPTPALTEAINFCSAFRDNLTAANAFARALEAQGLLEEEEATVNFSAGGGTKIRGFKIVRADRLDQVSDETFLDWRRRGWMIHWWKLPSPMPVKSPKPSNTPTKRASSTAI